MPYAHHFLQRRTLSRTQLHSHKHSSPSHNVPTHQISDDDTYDFPSGDEIFLTEGFILSFGLSYLLSYVFRTDFNFFLAFFFHVSRMSLTFFKGFVFIFLYPIFFCLTRKETKRSIFISCKVFK